MATDLRPTPARWAVLRAVADGDVWYDPQSFGDPAEIRWDGRKVTAVVNHMIAAGWVRLGTPTHPSVHARRPVEITDVGRTVLNAAGGHRD